MSRIVLAVLAMIAALALSFDASAQKKCKKGYYFDADTGKCVPRRGSG
jgi:hypothetical protein